MTNNIYAYWDGKSRHWFYDLCWDTVKRKNPGAVLLSKSDVIDVLGPLPQALTQQYVVHQCDWIRKKFIGAVGGAWLDMDFICWSDMGWLAAAADSFDFVGWKEWHGTGWMDNLFAGCKGSAVLSDAADYALQCMARKGSNVAWLDTNAHAMNYAMGKHPWCRYMQIPSHVVSPVSVMDTDVMMRDTGKSRVDDYQSAGFMASMHGIGGWLKSFSGPDEFLASGSILSSAMHRALNS